jgi:hypothetical protein
VGSLESLLEAAHGAHVGSRDNLEVAIMPAIDRGPDLLDHLAKCNDILALEVSALLRENLILNLNAGGARAFKYAHSARHIHGVAKSGVGIGKHWDRDGIADRRNVFCQFAQGHEADVGNAKRHVGDSSAGDVNRLEAKFFDHPREQRIRSPGKNCCALARQQCFQPRRWAFKFDGGIHASFRSDERSPVIKAFPHQSCQQF